VSPPIPPAQQSPYDPAARRQKPLKRPVITTAHSHHQRNGDRGGEPEDDVYLSSSQVRRRYANASRMWLWRRLKNDPNFPRPIIVAGRKLFKLSSLEAWERQAAAAATA
jgi:hypothetical protein